MVERPELSDTNFDPDRGTLERVAAGDVESFGILVERHQGKLIRLCERMLGNAEEARDAAQDIFLKALKKAGSYKPQAKVSTWLYRIAVNHCLNSLRRRQVVRFLSFGEVGRDRDTLQTAEFDPADGTPSPEQKLASRERWRFTRRAIEGLPTGQRAVLVLTKFEGLSYRETAQVLGITVGAVESRLFRAMQNVLKAQENRDSSVSAP